MLCFQITGNIYEQNTQNMLEITLSRIAGITSSKQIFKKRHTFEDIYLSLIMRRLDIAMIFFHTSTYAKIILIKI